MVMDDHDKNESAANRGQFDIVGSLPFYVLLDVVKYLYEADIVRSQRFSKLGRAIFTDDELIRDVCPKPLRRWA
ncbi:hypothetical protein VTN49DRAFT_4088 [Thermomyces lanuginosus]|uniref:uncharacterized protein n=1 Tax=Thermomyces lanuginosus TaxID=5541 RepID=UPI003741F801